MGGAVWAEGYPGVRGALVVPPVGLGPAGTGAEVGEGCVPGHTTIMGGCREQPPGSAVRPSILLPHRDDVVGIGRIHLDPRLDLAVEEVHPGLPRDVAAGEGTGYRHDREWGAGEWSSSRWGRGGDRERARQGQQPDHCS